MKLLDPDAKGRQVSHVIRSFGRHAPEVDTVRAIARLAALVDETGVVIDFARRRAIDYSGILPRDEWREICHRENVLPGSDHRWQSARAHLYALASGNKLARAPFADEAGFPTFSELSKFRTGMPAGVSTALEASVMGFLGSLDIDEPVSWTPSIDAVGLEVEVSSLDEGNWPRARPAQSAVDAGRAVAAYSSGRSVEEIAVDHGVARQTVARVLASEGIATRRGRRRVAIDPDWLRKRYLVDRRTILELAAEVGVTRTTINRHLEAAGIPRRARGSSSRAAAIRVDPRAGESPILRRVLVGQSATMRAERFLIVARHDTIGAAANDMGVSAGDLSIQMRRIGVYAGGPLITHAQRGLPLTLTGLGAEVRRELMDAFDLSEAEDPVPPEGGYP